MADRSPIPQIVSGMKLLLVDDNEKMRAIVKEFCSPYFSEIVECSDGGEAVERFDAEHPDWTVMDVRMPRVGGIEAASAILRRRRDARIILISQHGDQAVRQEARDIGAAGFVDKKNLGDIVTTMFEPPSGAARDRDGDL